MSQQNTTFGIASVGIAPLRAEPSDTAEMLSQLLVGELFQLLERHKMWWHVKALLGSYKGWMNANEGYLLSGSNKQKWLDLNSDPQYRSPYFSYRAVGRYDQCLIPPGSVINMRGGSLYYPFGEYKISSEPLKLKGDGLIETALSFLGTPYLWGGRTDTGIDCSGFIQTVLLLHGITFPRDSIDQSRAATFHTSAGLEDMKRGDIIYFNPKSTRISHVGFYLGDGLLLHASGKVKIEQIDMNKSEEFEAGLNTRLAAHIAGYQKMQELNMSKLKLELRDT